MAPGLDEIEKSGASYELSESFTPEWPGLCGHVNAWHARTEDPEWAAILERVMVTRSCSVCGGDGSKAADFETNRQVIDLIVEFFVQQLKFEASRNQHQSLHWSVLNQFFDFTIVSS